MLCSGTYKLPMLLSPLYLTDLLLHMLSPQRFFFFFFATWDMEPRRPSQLCWVGTQLRLFVLEA